jgi:thioredoxin reductase (NADPH)
MVDSEGRGDGLKSMLKARREQMFPKLSSAEIDRLQGFGEERRYAAGEPLFVTGDVAPGMIVLRSGSVQVRRRDPLGHLAPIVEQGTGEFVAEVGQLSGRPALVDVHAVTDVEAFLIPPEKLRALVVAEAGLGDRIMRALILRRVTSVRSIPSLVLIRHGREIARTAGVMPLPQLVGWIRQHVETIAA